MVTARNLKVYRWFHKAGVTPTALKRNKTWLGKYIKNPALWKLTPANFMRTWVIGSFMGNNPFVGFQLIPTVALCILTKAYLPAALLLTLITNPLTVAPYTLLAWQVGKQIILLVPFTIPNYCAIPLGCLFLGCITALLGFLVKPLYVKWFTARQLKLLNRK